MTHTITTQYTVINPQTHQTETCELHHTQANRGLCMYDIATHMTKPNFKSWQVIAEETREAECCE